VNESAASAVQIPIGLGGALLDPHNLQLRSVDSARNASRHIDLASLTGADRLAHVIEFICSLRDAGQVARGRPSSLKSGTRQLQPY
jgi:hypothetical protein